MKASKKVFVPMACWAVFFSPIPAAVAQTVTQQAVATEKPDRAIQPGFLSAIELPDSPGATISKLQSTRPSESGQLPGAAAPLRLVAQRTQAGAQPGQESESPQKPSAEPQPPFQKPVGTAAAGVIPATGVAASQPAGVAIAPAKQRRVRTIILRTGAIIGAGLAVGSVVALTEATPSKPPGAH